MKAAVYRRYGAPDVVHIEDVPVPIPKTGELLVKVRVSTLTAADWRLRRASPFLARFYNGLWRPKKATILGWEFAGVVEALGVNTSQFKVGDEVFGLTGLRFGAHAEYCCVQEVVQGFQGGFVALKPAHMSFEEAAAVPVGCLSAQGFLKKARLRAGHKVLIYGASGSVGTYAVQIAKRHSACVTGVCGTHNLDLVRALGADQVIDYRRQDVTTITDKFDIVFDAVGKLTSSGAKQLLKKDGAFVSVTSAPGRHDFGASVTQLKNLLETRQLRVVIDRSYPLEQIVQAHEYVERGHKKGNVTIAL